MANATINQVEEDQKKPSALESAARAMGIANNIGSVAFKAYDVFKPKEKPDLSMPVKKEPHFDWSKEY